MTIKGDYDIIIGIKSAVTTDGSFKGASMEIKFVKNNNPSVMPPEDQLGFGNVFSDHMFVMDYEEGKGWQNHRIVPFANISLHPASTVLHYGAEVFEGLKAYRSVFWNNNPMCSCKVCSTDNRS